MLLDINSPFGFMGKTRIQGVAATQLRELKSIEGSHEAHVGSEGTRITVRARRTETRSGFTLSRFELEGDTTHFAAEISHPLIRSRRRNLTLSGRVTYHNTETDIFGQKLSEDRIRAIRVAAEFDFSDRLGGISLVRAEIDQGLNIMNATKSGSSNLTRAGGRSDFTAAKIDLYRHQRLSGHWSILGEASGQYAFSQLLATEEFGFGGARFGRAFDPAEFLGDHGIALKVEPRYTDAPSHAAIGTVLNSYQLFGYGDWGRAWHIDNTTRSAFDTGASAGAGIRLDLRNGIRISFEAAKPMIRDVAARGTEGRDIRFFFSASVFLN
jgi:hemolysin activation/secretion protein